MISELITNLKYTFNIPFRINLKTIIMENFSLFHDGAHLPQRYYTLLDWVQGLELPFTVLNNNGNLSVQFN